MKPDHEIKDNRSKLSYLIRQPLTWFVIAYILFWSDEWIYSAILQYKIKNPDNIKHACIYYRGHSKGKTGHTNPYGYGITHISFELNQSIYGDRKTIPLVFSIPSNIPAQVEIFSVREKMVKENNRDKCYHVDYVEIISLIFWKKIYIYDFKDF